MNPLYLCQLLALVHFVHTLWARAELGWTTYLGMRWTRLRQYSDALWLRNNIEYIPGPWLYIVPHGNKPISSILSTVQNNQTVSFDIMEPFATIMRLKAICNMSIHSRVWWMLVGGCECVEFILWRCKTFSHRRVPSSLVTLPRRFVPSLFIVGSAIVSIFVFSASVPYHS